MCQAAIVSRSPIFMQCRSIPSSKRVVGATHTPPGVVAPMSITWITPPAHAISSRSSGSKIGTKVCTSALWTSPIVGWLLAKMSPGRISGLSSQPLRTMNLIASLIVWT